MKKLILIVGLMLSVPLLHAQHLDFQSDPTMNASSLFEKITKLEKKTEWFNVFLNMQGSFNLFFNDEEVEQAAFRMDQLRLEVKGNITDRIYYRYRQRLNRSNNPQALDNLPSSIDYAAVGFHVTKKLSIFAGKQCTAFGGFEFDLNPIEVYQYCDMLEYMSNFLTGIDFSYWVTPTHEFRLQIVDSRNGKFEELYGTVPEGIKPAKTPLGYTLNWNGNFLENKIRTRWSASIFHEAKKKNWYYYALGTEVALSKFLGFFDFMYSAEDIDRTGIIHQITETDGYDTRTLNTRYMALVLHLNYRICPKINLFAKGMYETARVNKANPLMEKGKYRTSWGYIGGIEYYPIKDNLHFFLNYIGRNYVYTNRAKVFGVGNSNPQKVELGLVYQLPMF